MIEVTRGRRGKSGLLNRSIRLLVWSTKKRTTQKHAQTALGFCHITLFWYFFISSKKRVCRYGLPWNQSSFDALDALDSSLWWFGSFSSPNSHRLANRGSFSWIPNNLWRLSLATGFMHDFTTPRGGIAMFLPAHTQYITILSVYWFPIDKMVSNAHLSDTANHSPTETCWREEL